MKKNKDFLISIVVTCFFIGRIKIAPGTLGSLCAFPIYFMLSFLLEQNFQLILFAIVALFVIGTICSSLYIKHSRDKDPKEIVIDEVVGQMLVIYHVCYFNEASGLFAEYILPFLFFRFFDIYKPWPISLADKRIKSGFGVMIDDVLAAVFAIALLFLVNSL